MSPPYIERIDRPTGKVTIDPLTGIPTYSVPALGLTNDGQWVPLAVDASGAVIISEQPPNNGTLLNVFSTISAVASGIETLIVTYTVPALSFFFLSLIEGSGENIAAYSVYKNGTKIAELRSYFGSSLNVVFPFDNGSKTGLFFIAGDVIELKVIHNRPMIADFEGRILGILQS